EYGYVKRCGDEIELVPISHPGVLINMLGILKYRTVAWGNRHYLALADERAFKDLCRKALMPNRSSRVGYKTDTFLRESDRNKSQFGLPRLPPVVWANFAIDEISLQNEAGTLRFVVDSLVSRIAPKRRTVAVRTGS